MEEQEVKDYMAKSTSEADWNRRCDELRRRNGGDYPSFWFALIIRSGFVNEVRAERGW